MERKSHSPASGPKTSDGAPSAAAKSKHARRVPLTDAERHKRFVDMALEVQASEDPSDFDKAFEKVTAKPSP
jgi:hypothetical protein